MTASEKIEQQKEELIENSNLDEKALKFVEKQYDAIAGHICDRADKDSAFAKLIMQAHKSFKRCMEFISKHAREYAVGNCAMVDDDTVYKWSEDYFAVDDKAEVEAHEKAEKQKAAAGKAAKASAPVKSTASSGTVKAPKGKSKKEIDGQMNLLDMWGSGI